MAHDTQASDANLFLTFAAVLHLSSGEDKSFRVNGDPRIEATLQVLTALPNFQDLLRQSSINVDNIEQEWFDKMIEFIVKSDIGRLNESGTSLILTMDTLELTMLLSIHLGVPEKQHSILEDMVRTAWEQQ